MEYLYYKSKKGNFGDDLNDWLWPKLFTNLPPKENTIFIGIGSLLHKESTLLKGIEDKNKIVFGTGIKPSKVYSNFEFPGENWDVKFLRGPLSSRALDDKYEYISDAAYALRQINEFGELLNQPKKYEISLMPYFHSTDFFDWEKICKSLGYHYISPLSEKGVEFTLKEIAASKLLISEAMHGAILADVLRVPWHRFVFSTPFTEGGRISDFKWNDWLYSIDIFNSKTSFIPLYERDYYFDKITKRLFFNYLNIEYFNKGRVKKYLLHNLGNIEEYYLSNDGVLDQIDQKIESKIHHMFK